jgi:hypothetical protein
LAPTSGAERDAPRQLPGVTQIDRAFTASLRQHGSAPVFTLSEGGDGYAWYFTSSNKVGWIRLQRGESGCPAQSKPPDLPSTTRGREKDSTAPCPAHGAIGDQ